MKKEKKKSNLKFGNYFKINKKYIPLAVGIFIFGMILFLWPIGLIKENLESFLPGLGAWREPISGNTFTQSFKPGYKNLKSIGVALYQPEEGEVGPGKVYLSLQDDKGNVIYENDLDYKEIKNGFYDFEANLKVNFNKKYYLKVWGSEVTEGESPTIALCGKEHRLPENKKLTYSISPDSTQNQLVMRYRYTDSISRSRQWKITILLVIISALIIWTPPKTDSFRKKIEIVLFVLMPIILGTLLEHLTMKEVNYFVFRSRLWSFAIIFLVEIILYLASLSLSLAVVITDLFFTLFFTLNWYVCNLRGTPLHVTDFKTAVTAAEVAGQYDYSPNSQIFVAWCVAVFFIILALKVIRKKHIKFKYRIIPFVCAILIGIGSKYLLLDSSAFMEKTGVTIFRGWAQNWNYTENGFLVAFCGDVQNSWVREPDGYSKAAVENYLENYRQKEDQALNEEEYPHIVLIMNESLADLSVLGNLDLNQEYMPFINSLKENTIRGYVHVPVFGAGTANSEFEVFTGCSTAFLPSGCYPYLSVIHSPTNSLISNMKEHGYVTYAMHPEKDTNWSRDKIYDYFGFETCLWKEDFPDGTRIHSGISDLDTYYRVEEIFENKEEGEKLFIFDLTMQNHSPYPADPLDETANIEVQKYLKNISSPEADLYMSCIKESDLAFEQLVQYFEKEDEKVIICMFGDHLPNISNPLFYEGIYKETPGLSERDKVLSKYKTPFLIWANYDIEEEEGKEIGLNYLGVLLQKTAGIPMSPFFNYLDDKMQSYPIVSVNGYTDAESYHGWDEEKGEFQDYRIIQYNYLFGNQVDWAY